jgi:ferredoxin
LLRTAQRYELEIEGACEGVCACSTCHCILESNVYDSLPEPTEKEEDMLDQAFGLTPTSRLGCQVVVTKDMEGITVKLPKATRNFYVVS